MKNEAPATLGFDIPKLATHSTVREAQEHMAHHKDTPATVEELAEQLVTLSLAHLDNTLEIKRIASELIALQQRSGE
jgi:transcriptional regulator GlxA family with amidase domain